MKILTTKNILIGLVLLSPVLSFIIKRNYDITSHIADSTLGYISLAGVIANIIVIGYLLVELIRGTPNKKEIYILLVLPIIVLLYVAYITYYYYLAFGFTLP